MPQTLRLAHAVPALLVAYLVLLPLLAWWNPLLLIGLPLYAAAVVVAAFKVASSFRSVRVVPLAAGLTVVVHVCYGLGVARVPSSIAGCAGDGRPPASPRGFRPRDRRFLPTGDPSHRPPPRSLTTRDGRTSAMS